MEQPSIDRAAEAPHHQSSHQQRHAEVEIAAQKRLERIPAAGFFRNTSSYGCTCTHHKSPAMIENCESGPQNLARNLSPISGNCHVLQKGPAAALTERQN